LRGLQLPSIEGEILRQDLELLGVLNKILKEAEKEIETLLGGDRRVQLLRTIPGIGPVFAALMVLEIDDIERFPSPCETGCVLRLGAFDACLERQELSGQAFASV
jgi:transposase